MDLRLPFTRLTALSRQEGKPSQYVQVAHLVLLFIFYRFISFQDIVEENADLVHKLWVEGKGYLYVCGKVHFFNLDLFG